MNMTLSVRLNTLLINSFDMNIQLSSLPKFTNSFKKICSVTTCFFVFIFVEILSENVFLSTLA